jgi:hypothetical protein
MRGYRFRRRASLVRTEHRSALAYTSAGFRSASIGFSSIELGEERAARIPIYALLNVRNRYSENYLPQRFSPRIAWNARFAKILINSKSLRSGNGNFKSPDSVTVRKCATTRPRQYLSARTFVKMRTRVVRRKKTAGGFGSRVRPIKITDRKECRTEPAARTR